MVTVANGLSALVVTHGIVLRCTCVSPQPKSIPISLTQAIDARRKIQDRLILAFRARLETLKIYRSYSATKISIRSSSGGEVSIDRAVSSGSLAFMADAVSKWYSIAFCLPGRVMTARGGIIERAAADGNSVMSKE